MLTRSPSAPTLPPRRSTMTRGRARPGPGMRWRGSQSTALWSPALCGRWGGARSARLDRRTGHGPAHRGGRAARWSGRRASEAGGVMPGLWASMTENDYALHTYNFDSPAHDGSSQRYVYSGGVGCTPHSWNRVLHRARSDHGKQHLRVTAEHVILSYSADEADPDDPDAGLMVSDDAEAFAERVFDGHASVFSVQKDGRSGLWHAHLEIANVSHGPTRLHDGTVRPAGYALHESQRGVQALRKAFDKFLLEHRGFD